MHSPFDTSLLGPLGDDGTRLREGGERALFAPAETRPYVGARFGAPIPTPPTVRVSLGKAVEAKMSVGLARGARRLGKLLGECFDDPVKRAWTAAASGWS